jgi:urease accessory protein
MTLPATADRHPPGRIDDPRDRVTLTHDERQVRRRRMVTDGGRAFMADFADMVTLVPGEVLALSDGTHVLVVAADEALLRVTGDLPRLAWHIGNRHAACQVTDGALLVRAEPTMMRMLTGLGAQVRAVKAPFQPEGGAYGHAHGA